MKKLIPVILLMCILSGCSGLANKNNIIDLLSSPKLSQRESQVVSAIKNYLGEDIILKYPKQGSNISPVQITDLFSDGVDDAVVLYNAPNSGGNVRLAMLTQTDEGQWSVTFDAEGYGTEVYKVEFACLTKDGRNQLIVGYTFANSSEKLLSVYFMENAQVTDIQTESCQDFMIYDVTGDGVDDIVLAGVNSADRRTAVRALSTHHTSSLSAIGTHYISINNSTVTGISFGKNSYSSNPAIIIDYKDAYRHVYTEAVCFETSSFRVLMENDVVQKIWDYSYNLTSRDMDGDGYIETPTIITDSEYSTSALKFMEWTSYLESQPTRKFFGIADAANGIFLALPSEWQNYIRVQENEDATGWQISQIREGKQLMSFRLLASGEKEEENEKQRIVSSGTLQMVLTFAQEVSQTQIDYISKNIIYIK